MTYYEGHGWIHDGNEWYPDHDTNVSECWAPAALPQAVQDGLRHYRRNIVGHYEATAEGMMGARWNPDVGEWEWPEDLTA